MDVRCVSCRANAKIPHGWMVAIDLACDHEHFVAEKQSIMLTPGSVVHSPVAVFSENDLLTAEVGGRSNDERPASIIILVGSIHLPSQPATSSLDSVHHADVFEARHIPRDGSC